MSTRPDGPATRARATKKRRRSTKGQNAGNPKPRKAKRSGEEKIALPQSSEDTAARVARVKDKVHMLLTSDEKMTQSWRYPFKDGDRFESVAFEQLSSYGPSNAKNRYFLGAKLGEGSFSCVFKAWDEDHQEWVALKFTLSSGGREEFNVLRKLHMAAENVAQSLAFAADEYDMVPDGRCIIKARDCFDCTTSRGTVIKCIVMEYMPHCLTNLIAAHQPFTNTCIGVRNLVHISRQLISAVAFLHENGHVHCDIKPQNILYSNDDSKIDIRLADFGSCTTDGHEVNEYIVTRPYRPPEVMLGLPLTAAADVWSCGCVLMELIMGQPLFNSADHFQLVTAIVEALGMPSNALAQKSPHCDMYFVKPRPLTCPEAYDHPPLPPFVTIKRSRTKRATLYYHDSSTNTSSFDRPTMKQEHFSSANMQLPGYDWQMRLSSTTGNCYYANTKLGATQWQRPVRTSLRSKVEATNSAYFQVKPFCKLFSVIEQMLAWDPDERITAREALEKTN